MVFAQLLLLMARPWVHRPSLTFGLNGTSVFTAAFHSLMVFKNSAALTPSSLRANSSIVLAVTLVFCRMCFSSRCRRFTFSYEIFQGNWPGCCDHTLPVFVS